MICINARFLTQKVTGVQRFAIEISKELSKIRDDCIFLVPSAASVVDKTLFEKLNIKEVRGKEGHYWEQITLPMYLRRENNPLLLNLTNTAPCFYKNQIVTHHDVTYKKFPQSFSFSFRVIYNLLPRFFLKNSHYIITVSEFSKEEISNIYNINKDKIQVVYNAVGNHLLECINDKKIGSESDKFFLSVSSPAYHKNFHGLVNAFTKSDLNCKLKIVGDLNKVFSTKMDTVDDDRVVYLGRIDDHELFTLYKNAEAFLFPSFYEGFGIPPLEAQACGCPVISSDRASMREILQDSVMYFNPYDEDSIITSIKSLMCDQELKNKLKESGYINIQRFSWEESAKKINILVESENV